MVTDENQISLIKSNGNYSKLLPRQYNCVIASLEIAQNFEAPILRTTDEKKDELISAII